MSTDGDIIALIPARGGSKGVPRKNVRLLAGKPLIAYSIQSALDSQLINRVVVSTDDQEIADIAIRFGAEVPFLRPTELADDSSPEWFTWQHAIKTINKSQHHPNVSTLVCVPPTAPLRNTGDIDQTLKTLLAGDSDAVITVTPASRNPYFNMVKLDQNGYAQLVIEPDSTLHRRQDSPEIFDMTTVAYAARPSFVLSATSLFDGILEGLVIPRERALDIDTELDFEIAEFMITRFGAKNFHSSQPFENNK